MHRPSFEDKQERNAFWSLSQSDQIVLDGQPAPAPAWVIEACAEHQTAGYHADCIHCANPTGATLAAMEARLQAISAALNSDGLTKDEADSLFDEMAELLNRINSAEDDSADDLADMRRENAYGKGL